MQLPHIFVCQGFLEISGSAIRDVPIPSSGRTLVKRAVKGAIMNECGFVTANMRELDWFKIIQVVAEHRAHGSFKAVPWPVFACETD